MIDTVSSHEISVSGEALPNITSCFLHRVLAMLACVYTGRADLLLQAVRKHRAREWAHEDSWDVSGPEP